MPRTRTSRLPKRPMSVAASLLASSTASLEAESADILNNAVVQNVHLLSDSDVKFFETWAYWLNLIPSERKFKFRNDFSKILMHHSEENLDGHMKGAFVFLSETELEIFKKVPDILKYKDDADEGNIINMI